MGAVKHKADAPKKVNIGILSISSTRSLALYKSGRWIGSRAKKEGHEVVLHRMVPDDAEIIAQTVHEIIVSGNVQVILLTGGTGISRKDVTIEAVRPFFKK
jgi:molybdenum cofactor biosynthesis protein B